MRHLSPPPPRIALLFLLLVTPLLLGALCSIRPAASDEAQRIVVRGLLDEIVEDYLIVTPFATSTPTPTATPAGVGSLSGGNHLPGGSNVGEDSPAEDGDESANRDDPPAPAASPTPAPSPTPLPSPTATLPPSPTASPTPIPSATPLPTATPLPPPTNTPVPPDDGGDDDGGDDEETNTSPTDTPVPTDTPLPTATFTPTPTPTPTALPVISFSQASYPVNEGDGLVTMTVVLDQAAGSQVTVDYATLLGTGSGKAFAPNDYQSASGALTFNSGQTSRTFTVTIFDDFVDDPDTETIGLQLSNPGNATILTDTAQIAIQDNDPLPLISFGSALYNVAESGTPQLTIVFDRPSGKNVNFSYGPTGNGTATTPDDYLITFNAQSLSPGVTGVGPISTTVTWSGLVDDDDTILELEETIELEISLGSGSNVDAGAPITTTLQVIDD